MSKYILAFILLLTLDSCTVERYYRHRQLAPRKYQRYYRHKQRHNSRHRDSDSYLRAAYGGKVLSLFAETDTTHQVKPKMK